MNFGNGCHLVCSNLVSSTHQYKLCAKPYGQDSNRYIIRVDSGTLLAKFCCCTLDSESLRYLMNIFSACVHVLIIGLSVLKLYSVSSGACSGRKQPLCVSLVHTKACHSLRRTAVKRILIQGQACHLLKQCLFE